MVNSNDYLVKVELNLELDKDVENLEELFTRCIDSFNEIMPWSKKQVYDKQGNLILIMLERSKNGIKYHIGICKDEMYVTAEKIQLTVNVDEMLKYIKLIASKISHIAYDLKINNNLLSNVKLTKHLYDGKLLKESLNLVLDNEIEDMDLRKLYHIDVDDSLVATSYVSNKDVVCNFFEKLHDNIDIMFAATV